MKKNAPIANTLSGILDQQIGELVAQENGEALLLADTSAGSGLTPTEEAILSLSSDIQNLSLLITRVRQQTAMFETFMRALENDMKKLKKSIRR